MSGLVVVGSGPAGISAALYALRGGTPVTVISRGESALEKAEKIENYYGLPDALSGRELLANGLAQAKRLGAVLAEGEVVHLGYDDGFVVSTSEKRYTAKAVVLATGSARTAPPVPGLRGLEGRGVSYCALCDAFFYRGKDVAVLGCCEYALHEVMDLLPVASSVTLLTNGEKPIPALPQGLRVLESRVARLAGDEKLEAAELEDGTRLPLAGLFVAVGVAGSAELARQIGAEVEGKYIVTTPQMATSVPGLFAAGDCTGGLLQVAKAVHEGAQAGLSAVKYLRGLEAQE